MPHLTEQLLWACLIVLSLVSPTWADGIVRGQVVSVSGGDVLELVDAHGLEHRLRLAFIDAPEPGQPFGDEAQSALAAMVLGRPVTARLLGQSDDGFAQAEVIEPNGHLVNLELVKRGLAWHDYFESEPKLERDKYQAAVAAAQQARQGIWALERLELPRDYRARAEQALRWRHFLVAALSGVALLGLIFSIYDKRISAWLARQDERMKASAAAGRLAHIRSEANAAERDRTRAIADQEMNRLAALRRASEQKGSKPT
ncbi:thermonuclease family protein [Mitsuaria sp. WAJ17]|uniref:thermonuclease family protein n=1 Tax=Mitsuaria sp. WAJ17 TaxID=2761452 RepID=UPI0016005E21|nr:thermonuclease family protein [Mitsuaria sp. WAJ17]MBB2485332.1 thermonuclease family protein [Mitsuaria sp. WAJ17]